MLDIPQEIGSILLCDDQNSYAKRGMKRKGPKIAEVHHLGFWGRSPNRTTSIIEA
jgi:hypothetical protein